MFRNSPVRAAANGFFHFLPGPNSVQQFRRFARCALVLLAGTALFLGLTAGCVHKMDRPPPPASLRDINAVLADHDKELMAIPGVVGVYVGLLDDDKTPCLKVMVVRKTRELTSKIPKNLEGYPVVVEETGVIRPLRSP